MHFYITAGNADGIFGVTSCGGKVFIVDGKSDLLDVDAPGAKTQ